MFNITDVSVSSIPRLLWEWYLVYLWHPQPSSWVANVAKTFRILAFILIAPFVLLTLLDVTSYVIGRTLGVAESNASTSDKVTALQSTTPTIQVQGSTPERKHTHFNSTTDREDGTDDQDAKHVGKARSMRLRLDVHGFTPLTPDVSSSPSAYFTSPTEERKLQLSGYDVFSPAGTRPPSPTNERRHRKLSTQPSTTTMTSSASAESFGMVERDSSFEDAGVVLRKRGQGKADDAGGERR